MTSRPTPPIARLLVWTSTILFLPAEIRVDAFVMVTIWDIRQSVNISRWVSLFLVALAERGRNNRETEWDCWTHRYPWSIITRVSPTRRPRRSSVICAADIDTLDGVPEIPVEQVVTVCPIDVAPRPVDSALGIVVRAGGPNGDLNTRWSGGEFTAWMSDLQVFVLYCFVMRWVRRLAYYCVPSSEMVSIFLTVRTSNPSILQLM